MNYRKTIGQRKGGGVDGGKQVPPQAPAEGVAMPVNPVGFTNAEVRTSLAQMAHAITIQAQAMTDQVNKKNVTRENPPVCRMVDRLRDFTRMDPPIFKGCETSEDPWEFVNKVPKILMSIGVTDTEKEDMASYQLKDVAQTWRKMRQDSRVFGGVAVTWELFKSASLERFFPREIREAKV